MTLITRLRGAALAALGLIVAAPALAAVDLAGTTWQLVGLSRASIANTASATGPATATLSFAAEGGSCMLAVTTVGVNLPVDATCQANFCLPCTWTAGEGRQFSVQFDDAAASASAQSLVTALTNLPAEAVVVALQSDKGNGIVKKNGTMQLNSRIKADATLAGTSFSRRIALNLNFRGKETE
jgi:hypothetical protein